MRLNPIAAILALICALLLLPLHQHHAYSDDPDTQYSPVDPPEGFEQSTIRSIHKVSDNEFYVLFSNTPSSPPLEQTASKNIQNPDIVYHYLNGVWSQVSFDSIYAPISRIGGSGSTVFTVGMFGQIHKITGDNAAPWKDLMGPPDSSVNLYGLYTEGASVIAVGESPPSTNSTQAQAAVFLGSTTSPSGWSQTYTCDSYQQSCLCDVDGDGSGNIVAVGSKDGISALGIFSTNGGSTWAPIDFSAITDLPPLKTISYYPSANVFFLGGENFILWYSPGNTPTSNNTTLVPLNFYLSEIYQETAVGFQGMMAAGQICTFIPGTSGRAENTPTGAQSFGGEWISDPDAPSGLSVLTAIDGGSDVIIAGEEGTILRRAGDKPSPVPAALPVPTLSHIGMGILLLGMITAVIIMLRKRSSRSLP